VKTLYDAARYVEFKDEREASSNVGFTGEIQGISAGCQYKNDQPIKVTMEMLFELGRGPQAQGREKTYRYWVAVTDRNREILRETNPAAREANFEELKATAADPARARLYLRKTSMMASLDLARSIS